MSRNSLLKEKIDFFNNVLKEGLVKEILTKGYESKYSKIFVNNGEVEDSQKEFDRELFIGEFNQKHINCMNSFIVRKFGTPLKYGYQVYIDEELVEDTKNGIDFNESFILIADIIAEKLNVSDEKMRKFNLCARLFKDECSLSSDEN